MKQASFHLRTLGPVTLTRADGTEVTTVLSQPKRLALLVYLAVANRGAMCRRDTVLGVFWPEFNQERARAALRKALYFLRQELGDGVIVARGDEEIGIDSTMLSCDFNDFEAAFETNGLETAVDAYAGDFLDGFYIADAPDFEQWTEATRGELKNSATHAAERLAQSSLDGQDSRTTVRWARAWVGLAPMDEAAARALMTALDHAGERAEALEAYDELATRLHRLDLEPSAETQSVAADIRQTDADLAPDRVHEPAELDSPAHPSPQRRSLVALVGALTIITLLAYAVARLTTSPSDDDRPSVAVSPFTNLADDVAFASLGAVYQRAIADGMAQVPGVRLLASNDAGEATLTVSGSFHRVGDSLEIVTEIIDRERDRTLPAPLPVRVSPDDPAARTDVVRRSLMGAIGYYTDRWNPTDPVRRPPNWEAYTTFQTGLYTAMRGWGNPSIMASADSTFRRVLELDPNYTEAYSWLAAVLSVSPSPALKRAVLPQVGRPAERLALVEAMRTRVRPLTELDRAVANRIQSLSSGDYEEGLRWAQQEQALLPSRPNLALLFAAAVSNQPHAALSEKTTKAYDLWYFDYWVAWALVTAILHLAGDYEGEAEAVAIAATRKYRQFRAETWEIPPLAGLGDVDRIRELTAPNFSISIQGGLEVRAHALDSGNEELLAESDRLLRVAVDWYDEAPDEWGRKFGSYWVLPLFDRVDELATNLEAMVRDSSHLVDVTGMLGVAYARQGKRAAALAIDSALAKVDPTGFFGYHTLWRARIAAQLGQKADAVGLLDQAFRDGTWFHKYFPTQGSYWHTDPDFEVLRGYPPYERLVAPKQ